MLVIRMRISYILSHQKRGHVESQLDFGHQHLEDIFLLLLLTLLLLLWTFLLVLLLILLRTFLLVLLLLLLRTFLLVLQLIEEVDFGPYLLRVLLLTSRRRA